MTDHGNVRCKELLQTRYGMEKFGCDFDGTLKRFIGILRSRSYGQIWKI